MGMYWALDNVRRLAKYQQSAVVDQICDIYQLYNGYEPSIDELSPIFAGIKQEFADEAAEEILEDIDEEIASESEEEESEDDDGSAYDPSNESDLKQAELDEADDWSESEDEEQNDDAEL